MSQIQQKILKNLWMTSKLTIAFSLVSVLVFTNKITPLNVFYTTLVSAMYCFGLSFGSGFLADLLDHYLDWTTKTRERIIYGSIANIIYIALVIIAIDIFIIKILENRDISALYQNVRIWKNLFIFIISLGISTFFHAKAFMTELKASLIKQKELEKENIKAQYEALKSQTDPHFFFNSLNSLSSLIDEDKKLSQQFIKELANIYRYILEQKDRETSSIADELNFIDKYVFLQKIRFEDGVSLNINVDNDILEKQTISLALQIVFENIFKHNAISDETPIVINITSENGYLLISNNVNPKRTKVSSNKIGLENIKARYSFFTDKKVIIEHTSEQFTIKLPLLTRK